MPVLSAVFCSVETRDDPEMKMSQWLHTFLEKIHILHGGPFEILHGDRDVIIDIAAVVEEVVVKTEQVIKQVATLPSPLLPAGPPSPTASPLRLGRRRGLRGEVDPPHDGSIDRRPDAPPVPAGQSRAPGREVTAN